MGQKPIVDALGWCSSWGVLDPHDEFADGKKNIDMFYNAKAQAWWELRMRFIRTYEALMNDEIYDPNEMISLNSQMVDIDKIKAELGQPTFGTNPKGKIIVDKKPDGQRSPNRADAIMMLFARIPISKARIMPTSGLY